MNTNDYTPTELAQANRLEAYLLGLESKQLVPPDITSDDITLYRTARKLATGTVQPRRLVLPAVRRWKLKSLALWLTPLPLVAIATVIYFNQVLPSQQTVDISADLAAIEQDNNNLLAMEAELDQSLAEIDLLTSTDYIDQL